MASQLNKMDSPYFAVIFSSLRTGTDKEAYEEMSERMVELAREQEGFVDVESVRDSMGRGITISYWQSLEAITNWKRHTDHVLAQKLGQERWYESFKVRVCRVEREYGSKSF